MTTPISTVSTLQALLTRRRIAADLQDQMGRASQEVSTGTRADVYRSLGMRSAETLALRARMDRNAGLIASNQVLGNRMEMMAELLGVIRGTAQGVLDLAISSRDAPGATVEAMQTAARTALDQLQSQINASYHGAALFAGVDSGQPPLQGWDEVNPRSGLSPRDVVEGVIGGGFTGAADAAAKAAELETIFASADAGQPARNFEATFYNGTPRLDAGGAPSPRLTAHVEEGVTLSYGVQANDAPFTELLRGLSMLAATDPAQIADPDAYRAWVGAAVDAVSAGVEGLIETEARLGGQQQLLAQTIATQTDRNDLYNSQILSLEGVDPYEAASRLSTLQTQLEATYAVTARLSRLSFLNFM
ncbi:flagellin [Actibacterium sp. MT2.3-13A]|uniref:flagellin n=1 Tax=Actibacterium sp. MT2.3-13A TaxID=2828332 RepID=UPI001BAB7130|nr:flagellin [Actibacterium sp. MT2.3-13A]